MLSITSVLPKTSNLGGIWHVVHKITNMNIYNIRLMTSFEDDDNESSCVEVEEEGDTDLSYGSEPKCHLHDGIDHEGISYPIYDDM